MVEKSKQFKRFLSTAPGKVLVGVFVLAVLIATTVTVYAVGGNTYTVTVLDAAESISVESESSDPNDILAIAGIELGENDSFVTENLGKDNATVSVLRSMKVTVIDNGRKISKTVAARTVADAVSGMGIILCEKDSTEPSLDSVITDGTVITVKRVARVTITADGVAYYCQSDGNTVEQLLEQNEIELGEDDEVTPALNKVITDDTKIEVGRVVYKTEIAEKTVKYGTTKVETDTLDYGKTKVKKNGVNGLKTVTYKVKYVNGEETKRTAIDSTVTKKAVNCVLLVGTKRANNSGSSYTADKVAGGYFIDGNGKKVKYKTSYTGQATAYTAANCNSTVTASGMSVAVGRVAVDPRKIPYGTKLYITGYGYCVAADTGGFVYNSSTIVDLYMNTNAECTAWGRRTVTMYVLA